MKPSDARAILIAPVFVYAAALGFARFAGWDLLVGLVTVAMGLPLVELLPGATRGRWFVPAWVLSMIAGVGMAFSSGAPSGVWADVGAGVLLGAPLAILAGLLVWRTSRLVTLVGLEGGLASLVVLVATSLSAAGGGAPGSTAWLVAFSRVNTQQVNVLAQWIVGNPPTAPAPLAAVADPVFLGLGVLAAVAIILALLERPVHAGAGPDPWDPHFSRSSGVVPLVVAMLAGLSFEWTAAVAPHYALLGVAAGVVAGLGLIVLLVVFTSRRRDRTIPARSARGIIPGDRTPAGPPAPAP
ncbi:MAG TPA: hypothetical protein VGX00_07035 [Thermoplasmata archaeon]|nr:hypothetical protein [Thermoplasmata archaeon]